MVTASVKVLKANKKSVSVVGIIVQVLAGFGVVGGVYVIGHLCYTSVKLANGYSGHTEAVESKTSSEYCSKLELLQIRLSSQSKMLNGPMGQHLKNSDYNEFLRIAKGNAEGHVVIDNALNTNNCN